MIRKCLLLSIVLILILGLYACDITHVEEEVAPKEEVLPTKIVFTSDRDGNREIYVMNADGSDATRLTTDPGFDSSPSWSPLRRQ